MNTPTLAEQLLMVRKVNAERQREADARYPELARLDLFSHLPPTIEILRPSTPQNDDDDLDGLLADLFSE